MSHILTRDDVQRIAALARLDLTPDEADLFSGQLTAILTYADQVHQADTDVRDREPVPASADAAVREDVIVPSLPRAELLSQASSADRAAGFFTVPRVLGS